MNGGIEDACVALIHDARVARIRQLNDELRRNAIKSGRVVATRGIYALGTEAIAAILSSIAMFDDFEPGNDPYLEHDMGSLQWAEETILWKVDYYDVNLEFGSPDPADPAVTTRMLTLMLSAEY